MDWLGLAHPGQRPPVLASDEGVAFSDRSPEALQPTGLRQESDDHAHAQWTPRVARPSRLIRSVAGRDTAAAPS